MNRRSLYPTDEDYDHMHHALGRPAGSWVKPYRNYFVCEAGGADAKRFDELGSYWQLAGLINGDRDAVYRVMPEGQRNVMAWLAIRDRASGLRPWVVMGGGITARTIVAKSAAAAKHAVYLELSDVGFWSDYRAFVSSGIRARAA
jgi:hypothetical protein